MDSLDEEVISLQSQSSSTSLYSQISNSPSKFWSSSFSKSKSKFNSASGRSESISKVIKTLFDVNLSLTLLNSLLLYYLNYRI